MHDFYNFLVVHALLLLSEADYAANMEQPYAFVDEEGDDDIYKDIVHYRPSKVYVSAGLNAWV